MEWFNNLKVHDRFAIKCVAWFLVATVVMVVGGLLFGPAVPMLIVLVTIVFVLARQWHKDWMQ